MREQFAVDQQIQAEGGKSRRDLFEKSDQRRKSCAVIRLDRCGVSQTLFPVSPSLLRYGVQQFILPVIADALVLFEIEAIILPHVGEDGPEADEGFENHKLLVRIERIPNRHDGFDQLRLCLGDFPIAT